MAFLDAAMDAILTVQGWHSFIRTVHVMKHIHGMQ